MASTKTDFSSPSLQESTKKSTTVWRDHLEQLFHNAKDRFPDVVWEVGDDGGDDHVKAEEVWGHKAIVYARAPPSFQSRYFSLRNPPYSSSPTGTLPSSSDLSLDIIQPPSRTPSPYYIPSSPTQSTTLANNLNILRLTTSITPALFSNELEYLYTGQGFGEAFEFLFDTPQPDADAEELRVDKLRKDLVYMWRSRLYSDVRISLTGNFSSSHENTTAIFSSHRFILVSRSPYFHDALLSWSSQNSSDSSEPPTLSLPSPPFTPASLHFTLGFIYTGTLVFSHRSYDLTTAFQILRTALYLSLPSLHDEIQARLVQEMLHSLFHAFLPFQEYERLTAGAWGTSGCRCRQCARRIPRVLEFALADDVKNPILERGARRALVGLFGEGWCTSEFSALHVRLREGIMRGLAKRTTPPNAFPLLFAAEHALGRLSALVDAWASEVKDMVFNARKVIDEVVCSKSEACFNSTEWNEIMERDGVAFEDGERVEWIMASVSRGVNDRNAPALYQTLVSSILLRPHPTESHSPILPPTSRIRIQVEQARVDLLKWISKRWLNIRQEGGFDVIESWAANEISDNIEVPIEDLVRAASGINNRKPPRPSTLHHRAKETESMNDTLSIHSSVRSSVINRFMTSPVKTSTSRISSSANGRKAGLTSTAPASSSGSMKSFPERSMATSTSRKGVSKLHKEVPVAHDRQPDHNVNIRPDSKPIPEHLSDGLPPYLSPIRSASTPYPNELHSDRDNQGCSDLDDVSQYVYRLQHEVDITHQVDNDDSHSLHPLCADGSAMTSSPNITTSINQSRKAAIQKLSPSSTTKRRTASPGESNQSVHPVASNSSIHSSISASTIRKSHVGSGIGSHVGTRSIAGSGTRGASTLSTMSTSSTTSTATTTSDEFTGTFHTANSSAASLHLGTPSPSASSSSTRPIRDIGSTLGVGIQRARKTSASSFKSTISVKSSATSIEAPTAMRRAPVAGRIQGGVGGSNQRTSTSSARSTSTTLGNFGKSGAGKEGRRVASSTGKGIVNFKGERLKESQERQQTEGKLAKSVAPRSPSIVSGGSTVTLKRRGSGDTITTRASRVSVGTNATTSTSTSTSTATKSTSSTAAIYVNSGNIDDIVPRGATLEIGIPCIISSKRKRFKAYARYIGEVEGEEGPWVGVEVPVSDNCDFNSGSAFDHGDERERQWHDGTWGGIRYFEIRNNGDGDWDYGDDARATRRQRVELVNGKSSDSSSVGSGTLGRRRAYLKREGDADENGHLTKRIRSVSPAGSDVSCSESKGLFVRPQQVLYVVDALGTDL